MTIYLRSSCSSGCRALKTAAVFMNLRRVHFSWCRWFASSPSTISSSVSWISPLRLSKFNAHKPDPPPETTTTRTEGRRKSKYISHDAAINLIKRERDPQHALEIFNMVSEQKGFNHNNATYATILNKLGQSKKFKAVDAVLYQMKYDACKYHEVED
ncbi:hypothetical protein RchiOBHm_Chr7g0237351 [Rosa chinensis]|uniref:Uncharacterized protein n=1 Tax=Rosa chinensis TaxID=74649 RepID=A0A2P6PH71_ROSCH|nr:hypothetical protein RchiOBHm_Chr7g0237351 [Rosa chinensis]